MLKKKVNSLCGILKKIQYWRRRSQLRIEFWRVNGWPLLSDLSQQWKWKRQTIESTCCLLIITYSNKTKILKVISSMLKQLFWFWTKSESNSECFLVLHSLLLMDGISLHSPDWNLLVNGYHCWFETFSVSVSNIWECHRRFPSNCMPFVV